MRRRWRWSGCQPTQDEREGSVPSIVFACGALVHDGIPVMPYGRAGHATGFATIALDELLAGMR
ncbi:MAG: hypothetical protein J0L64_12660 [Acidobacteria bacterium]|nr:hypothetical protein [Acidobacteriota bacterium]